MIQEISIESKDREELIDISDRVQKLLSDSGHDSGYIICFVPHTTAGITINENADPDVRRDMIHKLRKEIPQRDEYRHAEGNSDAHIKASLMGFSQQVLFENRRLVLGTWQGIYFCEFDGPRHRKLLLKFVPVA